MMNVIFTCGGTAGHVNPALALAGLMQERDASVNILFVGSKRGMEGKLVEKAGYAFRAIEIDNFRRSFKVAGYSAQSAHSGAGGENAPTGQSRAGGI